MFRATGVYSTTYTHMKYSEQELPKQYNTTQCNSPKTVIFKENELPQVGLEHTIFYMDMTLIIHEMLRKTRHGNTAQQKDKATQHNSPKAGFFQRKISCLRWDSNPRPSAHLLSRQRFYQPSYHVHIDKEN